jgi:hypothetical protein
MYKEYNTSEYDTEYKEGGKYLKDWNVLLVVEDKEGLTDSLILTIEIEFDPPPVPYSMPFVWVFTKSLPLQKPMYSGPLVLVVALLNIIGLAVIMLRRKMLNGTAMKKKKGLKAAAKKKLILAAKSQETAGFTGYKKAKAGAYQNVESVSAFNEQDKSQFMIAEKLHVQEAIPAPVIADTAPLVIPAAAEVPPAHVAPAATQPAVTTAPPSTQPAVTTAPPITQPAMTTMAPVSAVTTAPAATQPAAITTTAPAVTTAPAITTAPATTTTTRPPQGQ